METTSLTLYLDASPRSLAAKLLASLIDTQHITISADTSQVQGKELPTLVSASTVSGDDALNELSRIAFPSQNSTSAKVWVDFAKKEIADASTPQKTLQVQGKLNKSLLSSVYLVGTTLSLSDIIVYASIHPLMKKLQVDDFLKFPCLARWFDLIQNTTKIPEFTKISIPLNAPLNPPQPKKGETKESVEQPAGTATTGSAPVKTGSAPAKTGAAPAKTGAAPAQPKGKAQPARGARGNPVPQDTRSPFAHLDIRVGKIISATRHPASENLYIEQIDLGESKPRTVVSGLVKFVPEDKMQGARVICLCNLKPQMFKAVNTTSEAMVMCAGNADKTKVELIAPPEGAALGERVRVAGHDEGEPDQFLNPKKKYLENAQKDLIILDTLEASYKGIPFQTSAGSCKAETLIGGKIS